MTEVPCVPHASPQVIDLTSERAGALTRARARLGRELRGIRWRSRLQEFGAGSDIVRPFSVFGGQAIRIGSSVRIWHGARIEAFGASLSSERICIGDGTIIHPFVHIGAAMNVTIGRGVLMASHIYITDHDHDWYNPADPPVSNRRLIVQPVQIGDYVWLGERVMVLKGVTIGDHSVIGAGSVVTRSIPAYSIAVGSPAKVVRRYDHDQQAWVSAR